ncbi:MAG: hypothetical protein ABI193_13555 [Minicystis sp.]
MSGGGGGSGNLWKILLAVGVLVCGAGVALEHAHVHLGFFLPLLQAAGGLMAVFGSCEAMILCVEGLGERKKWNPFVAGTMAGLASNVPEIIMIGFVVAAEPRVAFVVSVLTLHVNALVFGVYSGLLPKDTTGHARLPEAITKLGSDLLACAAGLFLAMGSLMLTLHTFDAGDHRGEGLGAGDLTAVGVGLLFVQVVSVIELLRRFAEPDAPGSRGVEAQQGTPPSITAITIYGLLGMGGSFVGGHAVGEFADALVKVLIARGYSEMVGAIVVSLFSGIASYLMIASAHVKGKIDIALSNVSGAVTQMPFVVFPCTLLMMAAFAQLGIIPRLPHGGVLAIDLETTSVLLFAFPTLLLLRQSISDDGMVNRLETAAMVVLFGLIIYFLAQHG